MTSEDLRAAANRLADIDPALYRGATGNDADLQAGGMLARAWLAEHDTTPVSLEWFQSAGATQSQYGFLRIGPLQWDSLHDVLILQSRADWYQVRTRGQVRRICAALGVPLKETS